MTNIVALGDATTHGAPICTEPNNNKIKFNGVFLACKGAFGPKHVGANHPLSDLVNTIDNPRSK